MDSLTMLDQWNIHHHHLKDAHACMSDKGLQKSETKTKQKSTTDVRLSEGMKKNLTIP